MEQKEQKEQKELIHSDYIWKYKEKEITLVEFVINQPDLYPDFEGYLKENNLKKTDKNALKYMTFLEETCTEDI